MGALEAPDTTPDGSSPKQSNSVLPVGTVLNDVRVDAHIGAGGQGEVYAVTTVTGERQAIKVMSPDVVRDGALLARLEREAASASSIQHPHVTRIFGLERVSTGHYFIRMELLDGEPLDRLLRMGPLPADIACSYAVQIAAGLGAAHELGIIHRDVKPGNIFVAETAMGRQIKIMDFGIAKATRDENLTSLTNTGSLIGTPAYMSPEQILLPDELDHRSDIYSLGLVFFEMLCGRRPFKAERVAQLLMMHVKAPPPHPKEFAPRTPYPVAEVVLRCLAKRPESRFSTMRALIDRLEDARTEPDLKPIVATPNVAFRAPPARLAALEADAGQRRTRWPVFLGVGVLVLTVLSVFMFRTQAHVAPTTDAPVKEAAAAPNPPVAPPVMQPGEVRLASRPSGAAVFLGDVVLGQTPLDVKLAPEVAHRLVIRRDGYETRELQLRLQSGEVLNRAVVLDATRSKPKEARRPPPPAKVVRSTRPTKPTTSPRTLYNKLDRALAIELAQRGLTRSDLAVVDEQIGSEWLTWRTDLDASSDEIRFNHEILLERIRTAPIEKRLLRKKLRRVLQRLRGMGGSSPHEARYVRLREQTEAARSPEVLSQLAKEIAQLETDVTRLGTTTPRPR